MQNRTSIHLNPDSVQIEVTRNGQRSIKNTNIQAIQEVLTRGERIETPLLPSMWGVQKYTKINNREQYVLTTPPFRAKTAYDMRNESRTDEHEQFEIITPAIMWIFHVDHNPANDSRRYVHGVAYALKQPILGLQDQAYRFPFSNSNESYLCWGTERDYPVLGGAKSIQTIPDRFFANPFNSDLDGHRYRQFDDKVNGRVIVRERCIHLLQHLDKVVKEADKKKETPVFNNDILIANGRVGEIIEHQTRSHMRR